MNRTKHLVSALAVCAIALTPAIGNAGTSRPSMAAQIRAMITRAARARHVDPAALMSSRQTVELERNGVRTTKSMTVSDAIEFVAGRFGAVNASGPEGLPDYEAGDVGHSWGFAGQASDTSAFGYNEVDSKLVPATPAVMPVLGLPLVAWDAGGPLAHIKGAWSQGAHLTGFWLVGSNVDLDSSGPYAPYIDPTGQVPPLPVKGTGLVSDSSMDFIGHVYLLIQFRKCFAGLCVGAGGMIADGAAIFDNHPIAGVDAGFVDVP